MNRRVSRSSRTGAATARNQRTGKTGGRRRRLTRTIKWNGLYFKVRKPGPRSGPRRLREVTRLTRHLRKLAQKNPELASAPLVVAATAADFPGKATKVIAALDSGAPVTLASIQAWTGWSAETVDRFMEYGLFHLLHVDVLHFTPEQGDYFWLPLGHRYE